eukprot:CAMPEP_0119006314 /NCGR_PEP_ID=MMETSP1176-20130426/2227_1 /TAXON_ID=265551 /ORGANISM="Synedropsis recta cf, Strain CCMP1620" /LENGTH=566 /DNA_ID=CAMNT_0006958219 /DNA_START=246 /DNA_END=1943 /DNA_ORIENTATION=-
MMMGIISSGMTMHPRLDRPGSTIDVLALNPHPTSTVSSSIAEEMGDLVVDDDVLESSSTLVNDKNRILQDESAIPITGIAFHLISCTGGWKSVNHQKDDTNDKLSPTTNLHFCIRRGGSNYAPITSIRFQNFISCGRESNGWEKPFYGGGRNLNGNVFGRTTEKYPKYAIYACQKRGEDGKQPINEIYLSKDELNLSGERPDFLGPLDGNLNQGGLRKDDRYVSIARVPKQAGSDDTGAPSSSPTGTRRSDLIKAACMKNTLEILNANNMKYDPAGAKRTSRTVNGEMTVIDDFKPDERNTEVYKSVCEGKKARYMELSYEALCGEYDDATPDQQATKEVKLLVFGQPKCYSAMNCTGEHDQALFEEYTLDPTAKLANTQLEEVANTPVGQGKHWKCTGSPSNDATFAATSGCEADSTLLNNAAEMIRSYHDVKAKVVNKKFLWVIDMAQKYVKFEHSDTLETACDEHDGTYVTKISTVDIVCRDPIDSRSSMPFEVVGFSACISTSCETYDEADENKALAAQFKKKMLKQNLLGESGESMVCILSRAMGLSSLQLAIGASVSLIW